MVCFALEPTFWSRWGGGEEQIAKKKLHGGTKRNWNQFVHQKVIKRMFGKWKQIAPLQLEVTWYKIHWRAIECARLQNKTQLTRKVWFFFDYISQWSLVTFFCSPICWILYYVTSSCKRSIVKDWQVNCTEIILPLTPSLPPPPPPNKIKWTIMIRIKIRITVMIMITIMTKIIIMITSMINLIQAGLFLALRWPANRPPPPPTVTSLLLGVFVWNLVGILIGPWSTKLCTN